MKKLSLNRKVAHVLQRGNDTTTNVAPVLPERAYAPSPKVIERLQRWAAAGAPMQKGGPLKIFGFRGHWWNDFFEGLPMGPPSFSKFHGMYQGFHEAGAGSVQLLLHRAYSPGYWWLGVLNQKSQWTSYPCPIRQENILPTLAKWGVEPRWTWSASTAMFVPPWPTAQIRKYVWYAAWTKDDDVLMSTSAQPAIRHAMRGGVGLLGIANRASKLEDDRLLWQRLHKGAAHYEPTKELLKWIAKVSARHLMKRIEGGMNLVTEAQGNAVLTAKAREARYQRRKIRVAVKKEREEDLG